MTNTIAVSLGRRGSVHVTRTGDRIEVSLPSGALLRLNRPQAWALAEAIESLATREADP